MILQFLSSKKGTLSSKRLCGILGWLVSLIISVYCSINDKQAPIVIDSILITSTILLGVDSVTNIFKYEKKN